ncbi:Arylsulfatase [Thalassoglobus neptunius]|uniref:Arylsulfatase n=1 Tax=Thalassoglobus neptunius TaxID=1938619 RepID=A0A5C5X6P4_9PLAN|nr:sulfatase [Thalassoglobus neptunius]TWT58706.1 Arylsulfatase [Thalassoglobus neptunius]
MLNRFLMLNVFVVLMLGTSTQVTTADDSPNFIIIYADDLGYGDLSCYGNPTIRTPHLDQMAAEGLRFTQFYSASSVCTPSRAALMTGRLPVRSGMCSDKRRVLFPDSGGGIPESEVTLAEALREQGYKTACFGKWHLGHLPQFLPTSNGFDTYFGIPYSNDMDRESSHGPKGRQAFLDPKTEYWNVPIIKDLEVVERPADQTTITRRYTEHAVEFIKDRGDQPFFIYLPHSLPHVPLFRGKDFEDVSARGLYGDVIEEIDWSVGQILEMLRAEGIDKNTCVFFSSDNGPWLTYNEHGGSAGLLKEGKGATWEGGMREPGIAWWPGTIPAGQVTLELASTMDLYTTFIELSGGAIPQDRVVDGVNISPVLFGTGPSPRDTVFFYRGTELMAVRSGPWKAHFFTQTSYVKGSGVRHEHDPPLLYHLNHDPSERFNLNEKHPEVLESIQEIVAKHRADLVIAESQLEIPLQGK